MLLQAKMNEELVQKAIEKFSAATDLAAVVVDIQGTEISKLCNFTPFCQKMRENEKYRSICQKCDLYGGLESTKSKGTCIYKCHAGLVDFSVPIIVENQLVGFLLSGQVLCEDEEAFPYIYHEQTNWQDDPELLEAFQELPVYSKERIHSSAEILKMISDLHLKPEIETMIQSSEKEIGSDFERNQKIAGKNKEIEKALRFIDKNINRQITLNDVAEHVHLSSFYFSKLFKKETGKNFINYINEKKMNTAKEMLNNTQMSIDNIATSLGFSQTSYFCKVFRRQWGITPKNYRETMNSVGS